MLIPRSSRGSGPKTYHSGAVILRDQIQLLRPDDPAWDEWLDRAPHDVYHRAAYHRLSEGADEGQAFMVAYGNADRFMAWPYLVRPVGETDVDAYSVYGYPGPTGRGLADEAFVLEAWKAMRSAWSDQGLVALFTRFHPVLMNDHICNGLTGAVPVDGGEILHLGRSVAMDLSHTMDHRRASYPQVLRQDIKRAERAGVTVSEDPDWRFLPEFGAMYRMTMQKNAAAESYMYSDRYFDDFRKALEGYAHLAVAHIDGAPAAIMIYTVTGTIAQAHLTGINPDYQRLSPLKVLIDRVADLAAARGAELLHLGAGRGGFEDSLFAFKARFGLLRYNFRVGRWILRPERYRELVSERFGDTAPRPNVFPRLPRSCECER